MVDLYKRPVLNLRPMIKYGGFGSYTKEPYRPSDTNPSTTSAKYPTVNDIKDRIIQLKQTMKMANIPQDVVESINKNIAELEKLIEDAWAKHH